ncbi:MAG: CvpA family protein [Erysipelotrichaceae bacterium]|nr:CvpA family protein [Erysipelotrichaceae bacterium]MBQ1522222.1 CvpA family protein [Erysipelotrichaceae bacterium]
MTIPENVIPLINLAMIARVIVAAISGYKKGFIWEVLSILGVLVSILIAWIVAPGLADVIYIFPKNYAPFNGTSVGDILYGRLNYIVWFIIIVILLLILLHIIKPLFKAITELPVLKQINGSLGAVFSVVKIRIMFVVILYVLHSAVISNGKDIIEKSFFKYVEMASHKTMAVVSNSFYENIAIQKMISDPLSLTEEDLQNITLWLKKSKLSSDQIREFLVKYGIDPNKVNELINKIGKSDE